VRVAINSPPRRFPSARAGSGAFPNSQALPHPRPMQGFCLSPVKRRPLPLGQYVWPSAPKLLAKYILPHVHVLPTRTRTIQASTYSTHQSHNQTNQ
jgi:hypothetical protein